MSKVNCPYCSEEIKVNHNDIETYKICPYCNKRMYIAVREVFRNNKLQLDWWAEKA